MDIGTIFASNGFWDIVKIFTIVGLGLYLIFAFVVIKQVNKMTDTLEVGFEKEIRFITWLHLFFAFATIIIAIVVL